jgi:hypothetical protein
VVATVIATATAESSPASAFWAGHSFESIVRMSRPLADIPIRWRQERLHEDRTLKEGGFERIGKIEHEHEHEHMHVEGLAFEIYSLKAGAMNLDAP